MFFYAAVHAVNHLAEQAGEAVGRWDHHARGAFVHYLNAPRIEVAYVALSKAAFAARYRPDLLPMAGVHVITARQNAEVVLRFAGLPPR